MRGEHPHTMRMRNSTAGPSPHARGAQGYEVDVVLLGGPSPHARGAPEGSGGRTGIGGTIPACAGSTRPRSCGRPLVWDHPRMRGEHGPRISISGSMTGPSPRARGALGQRPRRRAGLGTIPACAGSTWCGRGSMPARRDHPRVHGEHIVQQIPDQASQGPSPRARGALGVHPDHDPGRGTIPACAGSTPPQMFAASKFRDHPRARGEHDGLTCPCGCAWGPSPRARGARGPASPARPPAGTIPACAGSTPRPGRCRAGRWDHPRMRGEHFPSSSTSDPRSGPSPRARGAPPRAADFYALQGPSPRARGALLREDRVGQGRGTIPACAGSTCCSPPSRPWGWDHPRVRGEH